MTVDIDLLITRLLF